jgi:hypothetical protein
MDISCCRVWSNRLLLSPHRTLPSPVISRKGALCPIGSCPPSSASLPTSCFPHRRREQARERTEERVLAVGSRARRAMLPHGLLRRHDPYAGAPGDLVGVNAMAGDSGTWPSSPRFGARSTPPPFSLAIPDSQSVRYCVGKGAWW